MKNDKYSSYRNSYKRQRNDDNRRNDANYKDVSAPKKARHWPEAPTVDATHKANG
jgi:hypothetical protein